MKVLSLGLLLFVSGSLAANISYSCRYSTGGVDGKGGNANKAGGKVTDAQEKDILDHIESWSDNKYTASKTKAGNNLIVKCKETVKTKTEATDAVNDQEKIVKAHKD